MFEEFDSHEQSQELLRLIKLLQESKKDQYSVEDQALLNQIEEAIHKLEEARAKEKAAEKDKIDLQRVDIAIKIAEAIILIWKFLTNVH